MQKYSDPFGTSEIIEELKNTPTLGRVFDIVNRVFPTWMVTTVDNYSVDYPELTSTWVIAASTIGVRPTKIIIVDYLHPSSDGYTLIGTFAELFTRAGFMVRRNVEFLCCGVCTSLIPRQIVYDMMKDSGKSVPSIWANTF
jgi:hypothetical protein